MLKRFVKFNQACCWFLVRRFPGIFDAPRRHDELKRRIENSIAELRPNKVIEIGGIDRPLLTKNGAFSYVGVDIAFNRRCYEVYDSFVVQSIENPLDLSAKLIFTYNLLEHVSDNAASIASIAGALEPGGATHNYMPSKWHPYSIILRIVGPVLQKKLLKITRPAAAAEGITGYPTFFSHCSPGAMRKLFRKNGLTNINAQVYYRANDYFEFFLPAYILVSLFENLCQVLRLEIFASGFVISANKPQAR